MKHQRIVFATFNQGKVREVSGILAGLPVEVLSPPDVGIQSLPEETGDTFLDNAVLKAAHVFRETGLPSVADDSGLEVSALSGAPGVHSARYAGVEHDDKANIRKLLESVAGQADREARFVCTVAFVLPRRMARESLPLVEHSQVPEGGALLVTTGEVSGRIIDTPTGSNGFGYDPVFYREDLGRTFAQLTREEKNALSHRGQAFRSFRRTIETMKLQG